ncbi:MAG: flavin reductase family protein [Isosphaeraceae bacterium]
MNTHTHSVTPLGQALGRVPSGLYILTVRQDDRATGMLASWVQQAGFEPPMVTVAVGTQRYVADWIANGGRCTLNQLPVGSKSLMKHFGRGFPPEADAFEGLELRDVDAAGPVLQDAFAYLDLAVVDEIRSGDHRVFLARVIAGAVLLPDSEPFLHVRANGTHY